jgi:hypothetical protein
MKKVLEKNDGQENTEACRFGAAKRSVWLRKCQINTEKESRGAVAR